MARPAGSAASAPRGQHDRRSQPEQPLDVEHQRERYGRHRRRQLSHLALAVQDEERSRRFYERHLGFGARTPRRHPDGVLMLYDETGFALALVPPRRRRTCRVSLHVGWEAPDPEAVRQMRDRLSADTVEIVEFWDERDYVSVKFRDPDGYVIEYVWEPGPASEPG